MEELVPSSIILTVNNKVDFNRWDISYRTDKRVIDIIESYNTTHDNILNTYFKFFQTDLNGFIDCNSETREETWNRY